ncbi:hypothetical protein JK359_20370 [Streptomyces actinomycinicus]|uniref:Uncharacterized protein n=1 Tax=Streptomyces actinomycinicus TaxID=1695166 RepID=A0A937JM34_9ACTN|nr:hypothetical protein [Streptomyces actinomycinicus]MBL1084294.1 hypothetical protein [Streptomyces actinomycinicus]
MSTYHYGNVNDPGDFTDHGRVRTSYTTPDLGMLMDVADQLTETLHAEYPGLVGSGEVIQRELARSADDGLPPNRGRIRSALETIAIAASAGTGSLAYTRHLTQALGL